MLPPLVPGKSPEETRVVVAMSGGVDSSVTAAMLAKEGYDVVGVTLQLYDHGTAIEKKGACCAGQDIYDARRVAEHMGFPHYVLDYESRFREDVIEDFADSYLRGETPIPCVRCNQTVKFRDLLATAKDLDADVLATGHYIERRDGHEGAELHRATDQGKDQSYFLFATTGEQLDLLRFPLGSWPKSKTRELANELGLPVADKPESMDICFVPDGDYAKVVAKVRPQAVDPGRLVHVDGRVMGEHQGIVNFTIGKRKGIGIGGEPAPLYVIAIDPDSKDVTVGPREYLARDTVYIKEVNWLGPKLALNQPMPIQTKLRSTMAPVAATVTLREGNMAEIELDELHTSVAAGQAAVFYDDSRVLGGGWIVGAERKKANAMHAALN